MRVIEKTVYFFNELGDAAKERAREWYRGVCHFDAENVIEDAAYIADLFGLDIRQKRKQRMDGSYVYVPSVYWSGFWNQGDGASFNGAYRYKKGGLREVMAHAPQDVTLHRIVGKLADLQKKNLYKLSANITQRGRYVHSGSMTVEVLVNDIDPMVMTDNLIHAEEVLTDCMRDFADWIYRNLEREYEHENSDEVVDELIMANEYEFDEEGRVV